MNKPNKTPAELSLTIHYAVEAPTLPRWKIRRWVERTMLAAQQDGKISFNRMRVGLRLVGLKEAQQLNASYRHKDYATNVLTFEYGVLPDGTAAGVISLRRPLVERLRLTAITMERNQEVSLERPSDDD